MRALQVLLLLAAAACATGRGIEPSLDPPGGLKVSQIPQFILFTHDDAVQDDTYDLMKDLLEGRQSKLGDGCPLTVTLFTLEQGTDCDKLQKLYDMGAEVADHTIHHDSLLHMSTGDIKDEIVGARSDISDKCNIPKGDIVGFRAPYLESGPEVRQVLADNGFLYDSSLIEETQGHSLSEDFANRIWPWDMASGVPINCGWYSGIMKCDDNEDWKGLYEVPVWDLSSRGVYTMDYGDDNKYSVYDILKKNFKEAYNGNKAPFPIYIHTPWLKDHKDDVARFFDEVLDYDDVVFVTMRQLLAWMEDPIPLDQLTPEALGCGNPGGAPGTGRPRQSGGGVGSGSHSGRHPYTLLPNVVGGPTAAPAPAPGPEEGVAPVGAEAPTPP